MADIGSKASLRLSSAFDAALATARAFAAQHAEMSPSASAASIAAEAAASLVADGTAAPLGASVATEQLPPVPTATLERIALRHRFPFEDAVEPGASTAEQHDLRTQLFPSCLVVTERGQRLWSLRVDARRAVLRKLVELGRLDQAVASARASSDEIAQWAAALVSQETPAVAIQTADQLQKTLVVSQWCDGIVKNAPDRTSVERRLALIRVLEPLARLIHRHEGPFGTVLPDAFVGRISELRDLREYVGVLPGGGWIDWRKAARSLGMTLNRPFIITGLGGIGKSTLVAKFLIDHCSIDEAQRFPFIYLDFDRPGVVATEPVNLVIEMTRQLGWQFEALDAPLMELREDLRKQSASSPTVSSIGPSGAVAGAATLSYGVDRLCAIIHDAKLDDRPLLLVCDTFEEVQSRLGNGVERLAALIAQFTEELPGMRTVIAGRDDHLDRLGPIHRNLVLKELDEETAVKLVISEGIDQTIAREVAKTAGGSPLTLRLACSLVKEFGRDAIRSGRLDQLWQILTRQGTDAYLYNRVLAHIGDPVVRELANPGLLLRRITPDIIREVMGPVRGKTFSADEAARIFDALRATGWLLEGTTEGNILRHRSDLRRACIPLINNSEPELSKQLHTRAADFYRQRMKNKNDRNDRIEWVYHELALGRDLEDVDREWDEEIARGVDGAMEEIVGNGRVYLKARGNLPLAASEIEVLPERIRHEQIQGAVVQLLAAYRVEEAAQLMFSRREPSSDPATLILAATVLDSLGDWPAATRSWHAAVKAKDDAATLLQAAECLARTEHGKVAADLYQRVFTSRRAQQSDRARAAIGMLFSARLTFLEQIDPRLDPQLTESELDQIYLYGSDRNVAEAADFLASSPANSLSRRYDQETSRNLILLAPQADRTGELMIEALRSGELPWLTVAQIDALCDPDDDWSLTDRQWLANIAFEDEDSEDVDIEDRRAQGMALADVVEEYGADAVSLLRPYFRNPCPQWYVPMATWLLHEIQLTPALRSMIAEVQRRANATEFQDDPLEMAKDGNLRLLVLLLEVLDRRGYLAPFLATAAGFLDNVSGEFAGRCRRFNLWLTALTGVPLLGPSTSPPELRKSSAPRRAAKPAAKSKKTASRRKLR